MEKRTTGRLLAVALSAGVTLALTTPGSAIAAPASVPTVADVASLASPEMLVAMQRDFQLTEAEAIERLVKEDIAAETEAELRGDLAASFAGAWLTDDQQLVVAVTDQAKAAEVRAAGAVPQVVAHSERQLNLVKSTLDLAAAPDAAEVTGWYVDVTDNTVVVQAAPAETAAAVEFVEAAGVDPASVRIEESTEQPVLYNDIRGGDAYLFGNSRCSVGFAVTRGFVTAGHCGGVGTATRSSSGVAQGTVRGSVFPGSDMAWVETNSNWVPRPWVNRYSGNIVVNGNQVAAIGAATCRSGSTTGYRCGNITARNQTVNYPQGSVSGLTRTTACAQGGDSGGSFIAAGINAQGVTSGGSGNCTVGGVTFFQPLNPILSRWGLTLVTG